MSVLDRILSDTREEVSRRKKAVPQAELEAQLHARTEDRPFSEALTRPGISVIADKGGYQGKYPDAGEHVEASLVVRIGQGMFGSHA